MTQNLDSSLEFRSASHLPEVELPAHGVFDLEQCLPTANIRHQVIYEIQLPPQALIRCRHRTSVLFGSSLNNRHTVLLF